MKIAELFYSIQGEGKLTGVPSVFVRTSGCNLRCAWCDTPYASWRPEGEDLTYKQVIQRVKKFHARHVVLTGGEPMIMPDLVPLVDELISSGHHVTVETAGTRYQPIKVHLASVSPKLSNSTPWNIERGRFADLHEKNRLEPQVIQQFIDTSWDFQLKFVVAFEKDLDEIDALLEKLTEWEPTDVLLMPEGVDPATLAARSGWIVEVCKARGFRFCPRLHVMLYGNQRGT